MAISRFSTSSVAQGLPKYQKLWDGTSAVSTSDFELIQRITLGSTGTVTFTSIPQTYKHLQLRGIGKTNRPTYKNDYVSLQFNSDTGANYSSHELHAERTSREYNTTANYSKIYNGGPMGSFVLDSNIFGVCVIDILDYSNSNKNSTTRGLGGWEDNSAGWSGATSGFWNNTAAVTSITLLGGEGTGFVSGTTFALYGIKGA